MKICTTELEFIGIVAPAVQRACKRYGYLPSVLIAQSAVELGYAIESYFDNMEIKLLLEANNMVGIKSSLLNDSWDEYTVWNHKSITKNTPEEYNGKMVTIKDDFRVYDSIEQSFCDFLLFLTYASNYGKGGKPKYGQEILSIKDPETLIKRTASLGYATGSTYPSSVMRIINKHGLTRYDDLSGIEPSMIVPDSLKLKYGLIGSTEKKETEPVSVKTAKGKKVMIDAGHYGYYNQSPAVKEYWESKMTWKLHLMLKEELEMYGIIVGTTRKVQEQDMALYDRGYSSKGYDLFISVHSNAVGDNVNESVDYPVCFVQISGKSDKIGTLLSECVREVMQTKQPADHWSQRGNNGDYYGVLRGATAAGTVGVIVEHSFHTQTRATKWLLDDANLRKLAVAEAKVINDYLVGTTGGTTTPIISGLSKGDKGDAVKTMQKMLIACGYSCGTAGADGDFGSKTLAALKAFQTDKKLTVSGIYDAATKTALENAYKALTETSKAQDIWLNAVKAVCDRARTNGYSYGNSTTLPPCEDKKISCDRLIARALWDLGYTDQPKGGITCGHMEKYLPKFGFTKVTDRKLIKPGAVVAVKNRKQSYINHVFVIKSYNPQTDRCDRYDTGSNYGIQKDVQPFKNQELVFWTDREFVAAWNIPEDIGRHTEPVVPDDPITTDTVWNGVDYKYVYNYTYYKKKYADLQKAFGSNKAKYFEHFYTFGMKEGRQASASFNVQAYQKRYVDLRNAFGNELPLYYWHYCVYGRKENRKTT